MSCMANTSCRSGWKRLVPCIVLAFLVATGCGGSAPEVEQSRADAITRARTGVDSRAARFFFEVTHVMKDSGDERAITFLLLSDFQCDSCGIAYLALQALQNRYPDRVRIIRLCFSRPISRNGSYTDVMLNCRTRERLSTTASESGSGDPEFLNRLADPVLMVNGRFLPNRMLYEAPLDTLIGKLLYR